MADSVGTNGETGTVDVLEDILARHGVGHQPVLCTDVSVVRDSEYGRSGKLVRATRHGIIVPIAGTGRHIVEGREVSFEPGSVVHILPGQLQRWLPDETYRGYVLVIDPFVCPPGLFDRAMPSPVVQLGHSIDVAHSLVTSLLRPEILPPRAQESLRVSLAAVLLELIAAAVDGPDVPEDLFTEYSLVADFRRELEFHYLETRVVADYAAMVGCSTKTLTRATNRLLGQTPKQIIDARVTYAAIRLLANTTISVNWISQKLGFSQQSNFAKFFARHVNMTPAAYREACKPRGGTHHRPGSDLRS